MYLINHPLLWAERLCLLPPPKFTRWGPNDQYGGVSTWSLWEMILFLISPPPPDEVHCINYSFKEVMRVKSSRIGISALVKEIPQSSLAFSAM